MANFESQIIEEFTNILGLKNQTDGTLFIYKKPKDIKHISLKPDGYYFKDGVTFILDAKRKNKQFIGQLEDYLTLEKNPNNVGFKYNGNDFSCYINGKLNVSEKTPMNADYYIAKYFRNKKTTLPEIVSNFAKSLAKNFRNARIDKQKNVPFIGAVMLCLKFCDSFDDEIMSETSASILRNMRIAIDKYIPCKSLNKKQKKEFLKTILDDRSLNNVEYQRLISIISDITTIYNFINIEDSIGHDTMNSFLKVFRKWNSVDAKEKGEIFTPDHIAQFMYKLANCSKDNYILDPTCGSGTFLVIAMFNMIKECKNKIEMINDVKNNQLIGIDDKPFNTTLAGINMMLHGDGSSNIFECDCFRKLPELKNTYDRALMNPPFSQDDNELKFVYETLENMQEGGICSAIVPVSSILSCTESKKGKIKPDLKYKRLILQRHNLLSVIRLPKKLFHGNASVQTAIITIQAHKKYNGKTWRKNLLDDGYIECRNVGRIDFYSDKAFNDFENQKSNIVNLSPEDDWPLFENINYLPIQKLDFMRQKLDFMLNSIDVTDMIIENEGTLDLSSIKVSNKTLDFNKWKSFKIIDLFKIEKGKDKSDENNPENKNGKIPLIIASAIHNGVGYYIKKAKKIFCKNCITLVNQGDGASGIAKAHSTDFAATSSIYVLTNPNLSPDINIFISTVMSKLHNLFDYTYSMTLERIKKLSIILPAIQTGNKIEPDWKYMEKYIKNEL